MKWKFHSKVDHPPQLDRRHSYACHTAKRNSHISIKLFWIYSGNRTKKKNSDSKNSTFNGERVTGRLNFRVTFFRLSSWHPLWRLSLCEDKSTVGISPVNPKFGVNIQAKKNNVKMTPILSANRKRHKTNMGFCCGC